MRVRYGATATIMTEYLISADERISERLATALLYGIKSDTLMLSRRVTDDDLQAFTHLYPLANYNLLRQIERPELPLQLRPDPGARDAAVRGPGRLARAASGARSSATT